jgi:hypothetical protein
MGRLSTWGWCTTSQSAAATWAAWVYSGLGSVRLDKPAKIARNSLSQVNTWW